MIEQFAFRGHDAGDRLEALQMGRTGIVKDVAHHLTGEFAKALGAKLAESTVAAATVSSALML